jgi:hypothetical protein
MQWKLRREQLAICSIRFTAVMAGTIGYILIGLLMLQGIFHSVKILAEDYFLNGFKANSPTTIVYSLLLGIFQAMYLMIMDDVVNPLFPEYILYVKLANFVLLCLVYGFGIVLPWKRG